MARRAGVSFNLSAEAAEAIRAYSRVEIAQRKSARAAKNIGTATRRASQESDQSLTGTIGRVKSYASTIVGAIGAIKILSGAWQTLREEQKKTLQAAKDASGNAIRQAFLSVPEEMLPILRDRINQVRSTGVTTGEAGLILSTLQRTTPSVGQFKGFPLRALDAAAQQTQLGGDPGLIAQAFGRIKTLQPDLSVGQIANLSFFLQQRGVLKPFVKESRAGGLLGLSAVESAGLMAQLAAFVGPEKANIVFPQVVREAEKRFGKAGTISLRALSRIDQDDLTGFLGSTAFRGVQISPKAIQSLRNIGTGGTLLEEARRAVADPRDLAAIRERQVMAIDPSIRAIKELEVIREQEKMQRERREHLLEREIIERNVRLQFNRILEERGFSDLTRATISEIGTFLTAANVAIFGHEGIPARFRRAPTPEELGPLPEEESNQGTTLSTPLGVQRDAQQGTQLNKIIIDTLGSMGLSGNPKDDR